MKRGATKVIMEGQEAFDRSRESVKTIVAVPKHAAIPRSEKKREPRKAQS